METSFGDFKEVGGIYFPHTIEGGPKGAPMRQQIVLEKIELNPVIDDSRFKMPAPAASPSPAAKK